MESFNYIDFINLHTYSIIKYKIFIASKSEVIY